MTEEFNFIEELKKRIINEADLQSGAIEFSYTGELVPFEQVEEKFKEFIKILREKLCSDKYGKPLGNKRLYTKDQEIAEEVIDELSGDSG